MSSPVLQVVSQDGEFMQQDVEQYFSDQALNEAGINYQIVAVTGPQSSGKSTLMNALAVQPALKKLCLVCQCQPSPYITMLDQEVTMIAILAFGTDFQEMNAFTGRQQTTKGIWLARSVKVASPLTLVLDLEGSDGRERGEDDNSFERQSSLFALAVTNVLVVNMWAKDVGREAGAGKPLLKTIFQRHVVQVNLKLFAPSTHRKRTVLLFVFRDKTKTPLKRLIETWEEDLHQMWASITKPADYENCSFTDLFQVEYASLPNFEEKEDDFRAESYLLRKRFEVEEEDALATTSTDQLPGSSLALSMAKLWQVIKEQRDLNLPAHKVTRPALGRGRLPISSLHMLHAFSAFGVCPYAEYAAQTRDLDQGRNTNQLRALESDQACASLQQQAATGLVPGFAARASSLLDSCLSGALPLQQCLHAPAFRALHAMQLWAWLHLSLLRSCPPATRHVHLHGQRCCGHRGGCPREAWPADCYEEEARYFEEGVRTAKGQELRARALDLLKPSFLQQLAFLREVALQHVASALTQEHAPSRFADISSTCDPPSDTPACCGCLTRAWLRSLCPNGTAPASLSMHRRPNDAQSSARASRHVLTMRHQQHMVSMTVVLGSVRQEALTSFVQGAQDAAVAASNWDAAPATVELQKDIDALIEQQKDKQAWLLCMHATCNAMTC
ncbi:Cell wall protein rhd3 [Sticta canariensis]|nr:Cell wall protein rhd3 [Sticta canariensis]